MKLASLPDGRDGQLILVDRALEYATPAHDIAPSLREALEAWDHVSDDLQERADLLERGQANAHFRFDAHQVAAPLPRSFQFLDGSAYLAHVERVRRARGAEMPPSFLQDPLMYQAVSDGFLGPNDPIRMEDTAWGIDFEAEVGVVTGDIPMGTDALGCAQSIRLVGLINDISLRNLIPSELKKGFGFLQSKPRSSLSPVLVTPDELGTSWRDGKLHLPLRSYLNGEPFGWPEAGEDMQFGFPSLLAHAAKTRPLSAGTLLGSGTVANRDASRGSSCLAERRMLEIIESGRAKTPFLQFGDEVRIEMLNEDGNNIFGPIKQKVEPY